MAKYVSRAPKKPRKSKVLIFLNVVIGILTAIVVFGLIGFFNSAKDNYYLRKFGDSQTPRTIEGGEYSELVTSYQNDRGITGGVNSGYEEAAAVAEYADAAMRYSAYVQAGESELAARQKARMDAAAGKVGFYEPELSRIDSALSRQIGN